MKLKSYPVIAALFLLAPVATAQESAHVHGLATLNLAVEGDELEIEFVSPADNIVGFEYEASTSAERNAIKAAIEKLEDASALFDLPASAGCKLHEVDVSHRQDEHGGEHDHGHDDHGHAAKHDDHDDHGHDDHGHDDHGHEAKHDDHGHDDHGHEAKHDDHGHDDHGHDHDKAAGEHSEFHAHYHFDCNGSQIDSIGLRLFEAWPRIEEIHLQALTPGGQFGGDIEADDPVIRLK